MSERDRSDPAGAPASGAAVPETRIDIPLEELLEAMAEGVVLEGIGSRILYANRAAGEILGLSRDEIVGRTSLDPGWRTVHVDGSPFAVEEHPGPVAFRTGRVQRDVTVGVPRPDGTVVWVRANAIPLFRDVPESPSHVLITFTDVTAERRAISALEARNSDLESARRASEDASEAKTEYVATMSHELRTPLAAILGFLQLILDGAVESPEQQRDFLRRAFAGGQRLLSMVNDVLDLTRIESGQIDLEPEAVSLASVLSDVHGLHLSLARQKSIDFELEPVDPALWVRADPGRVKQVLTNLVGNAMKFTPAGGRVTMSARADGSSWALLEVRDTGIGVPSGRLEAIFDRFVQADGGTARRYGGSGLGLHISRRLVTLMGGDLAVESAEGSGSRFYFSLPACGPAT